MDGKLCVDSHCHSTTAKPIRPSVPIDAPVASTLACPRADQVPILPSEFSRNVRLAASVKIVADAEGLSIKVKAGCDAIVEGYVQSLKEGGRPIVLAEHEQKLRKLGVDSFKPPADFWEKLNRLPAVRHPLATDVRRALEKTLPDPQMGYKVVRRQAGLGSLGQQRFVAIGEWQGGCVAREAKAMLPSACVWLNG